MNKKGCKTSEEEFDLTYKTFDEKIEIQVLKTSCDIKHNLARVHLGKKDYQTAQDILLELITEKEPVNVIPFYMDLLTISLKIGAFDKVEEYLTILREADDEFKVNTHFAELPGTNLGTVQIRENHPSGLNGFPRHSLPAWQLS
mgnify:CR=1 FL=1